MKKRSKLMNAADELRAFAEGRNAKPLTAYLPDGTKRSIASIGELRQLWANEGDRFRRQAEEMLAAINRAAG